MREIKFRAWDREKEEIAKVTSINLEDYEVRMEDEECRCWSAPYPYICILMQYTGLKDKNGVEIYEGDIVETEDYYVGNRLMVKGTKQIIDDIRFCGKLIPCVVIGNIYENPELLKYE